MQEPAAATATVSRELLYRHADAVLGTRWRALVKEMERWQRAVAKEMTTIYDAAETEQRELSDEDRARLDYLQCELCHFSLICIAMAAAPGKIQITNGGAREQNEGG